MAELTAAEIGRLRLVSLLLAGHDFTTPAQVATWFGHYLDVPAKVV